MTNSVREWTCSGLRIFQGFLRTTQWFCIHRPPPSTMEVVDVALTGFMMMVIGFMYTGII